MKITTTITKEERAKTYNLVYVDPCKEIDCTGIDCENCPLQATAEVLRKAQESFVSVLSSIPIAEEQYSSAKQQWGRLLFLLLTFYLFCDIIYTEKKRR